MMQHLVKEKSADVEFRHEESAAEHSLRDNMGRAGLSSDLRTIIELQGIWKTGSPLVELMMKLFHHPIYGRIFFFGYFPLVSYDTPIRRGSYNRRTGYSESE